MREELLSEVVVGERVDFEGQVKVLFSSFENRFAAGYAGIVDEDGGVAEGAANLGSDVLDGRRGAEVAFEKADRCRCWSGCQQKYWKSQVWC
jgi:hypothetical protein